MGAVGFPGEKIFRSPVTQAEMKGRRIALSVGLKPLGEALDGLCPEQPSTSSAPISGTGCLRKVSPVQAPGRNISDCWALPLSVRKTRVLILLLIFNIKRLACFRSEPGRSFHLLPSGHLAFQMARKIRCTSEGLWVSFAGFFKKK